MENSTDDNDYLEGIWRDDLPRGLLWALHDSSQASRYSQYIAPTWSWASIKGQVHFLSEDLGTISTLSLVNASYEPKANDRMGAISSAKLTLLAKVRPLCEVLRKAESSWYPFNLRFEARTIGNGAFDVNREGGKNTVWIMQCVRQKAWDFRNFATVLLLRGVGGTPDTYERVGAGKMDEDSLGFFDDCGSREVTLI